MGLLSLFEYTFKSYISGIRLILFFSLPFLIAFFIPLFVQTPTYIALGGTFLRTGSIPDLKGTEIAIMIFSFLASLFLFSFGIVNINLIIKSQRTGAPIKREVIEGIGKYTINVFWIFLTFELLLIIIQLLTSETPFSFLAPLFVFVMSIPVFYVGPALVIDEVRPWRALENSTWMVIRKFPLFLLWIILAFALNSIINFILFLIPGFSQYSPYIALIINSLLVMPFLLVLQSQIYITKYTIIR
ncbi:MAG: hypothetical protein QXW70_04100 [Candidatus Anstonellales archaeon]